MRAIVSRIFRLMSQTIRLRFQQTAVCVCRVHERDNHVRKSFHTDAQRTARQSTQLSTPTIECELLEHTFQPVNATTHLRKSQLSRKT